VCSVAGDLNTALPDRVPELTKINEAALAQRPIACHPSTRGLTGPPAQPI